MWVHNIYMTYYLAVLPAVYVGTQFAANRAMVLVSDWFTECTELKDDSAAVITAATTILKMHSGMQPSHPAFASRKLLEKDTLLLVYYSEKGAKSKAKWRLMRKDYSALNATLRRYIDCIEQEIRLFIEIIGCHRSSTRKEK